MLRSVPSVEWQRGYDRCAEDVIALCKRLAADYTAGGSKNDACRAFAISDLIGRVRALSQRRGP